MRQPPVIEYTKGALRDFSIEIGRLNDKILEIKEKYSYTDPKTKELKYNIPEPEREVISFINSQIYRLDSQVDRIIRNHFKQL